MRKNYLFAIIAVVIGSLLLYFFTPIVALLAISILISLIIDPFVSFFESLGIKRGYATTLQFIILGGAIFLFFRMFVPDFISQSSSLKEQLKDISINNEIKKIDDLLKTNFPGFIQGELLKDQYEHLKNNYSNVDLIKGINSFLSGAFSAAAVLFIIPFLTFFIVKDRNQIKKGLLNMLPNRYFEMSYWIMSRISIQLGRYVRGWIFDATFVGFSCGIGFALLGVPNAFALGIIAGFGHLIPYFGPVIGGVPAILLLIVTNKFSVIPFIILLIILIYVFDNGFVQPYVFSKSVGMHPVVIILLIIAGEQLFGILGMLFAVPVATVIKTFAAEFYFALKRYKIARG